MPSYLYPTRFRIQSSAVAVGCAALLSVGLFAASAHAAFTGITVFGDSLSDVGNTENATFGFQPGSNYFNGRFSNGPVYVELLANQLGLSASTPSSEGGNNYAYGGAWAGDQGGFADLLIQDLDEQITGYLGGAAPADGELVVVFAGGNDLIDSVGNVTSALTSLENQLDRLLAAGATQLLVPNLPRLGETPGQRDTANRTPLNNASIQFNLGLDGVLDQLETANPTASIYRLDVAAFFADALSNPGDYGFTNVTDPARGRTGIDADQYLFWDGLHPTAAGHALLADLAFTAIPEPSSLVLVAGLLPLMRGRRFDSGRQHAAA